MAEIFSQSKWIWNKDSLSKPEFVIFYKKVNFEKKPKKLSVRIACSTRYFFNLSCGKKEGKFLVWNGGVSGPVADYYDEIDISKFVKKGENAFIIISEYTPLKNGGVLNAEPMFIFEAVDGEKPVVSSDASFQSMRVDWIEPELKEKATRDNSFWKYDATSKKPLDGLFSTVFASNLLKDSEEKGEYDANATPLSLRPIPAFTFSPKPVKTKPQKTTTVDKYIYTVNFDSHKRVYPSFSLKSEKAMEDIIFYGDYPELRQKYVCHMNEPSFDFPFLSVMGDKLVIETPKTVKLKNVVYRSVGYGESMQADFESNDEVLNSIFKKSASTLYACISDRFISAYPKASFDFFDATVAAKDLMISYNKGGVALVKKMICDVLSVSENKKILVADPLNEPNEDPFAGLLCVSEFGFFAAYTDYFTDLDERIYNVTVSYLKKWRLDTSGLVETRISPNYNPNANFDAAVSENILYYSALEYAKALALRLNIADTAFIDNSAEILKNAIENNFFNGKIYSSNVCDDRANAFAVLAGLVKQENKDEMATFLASAQNASIYTECYIIEALCKLGRHKLASIRFKNRYYSIAKNASSSMPENFWLDGEQCCLHSAMPLYTLLACFGGVHVADGGKEVTLTPGLADLDFVRFSAMTPSGKVKGEYTRSDDKVVIMIDNDAKIDALVVLYNESGNVTRTIKLMKGKNKIIME